MRLFDRFSGTQRPADGVVARSRSDVVNALLALNNADRPFVVRDGRDDGVDLVVEWKIADRRWYGFFGKVTRINRTMLRLAERKHEVRAVDQEWEVAWVGDEPRLTLARSYQRGKAVKKSSTVTFSRDDSGSLVKESSSSFSTRDVKPVVRDAVTGCGWTWRGVMFGKLGG